MNKRWIGMLGIAGAGALLLAGQRATNAGDHRDSPVVQQRPRADIYDLYSWMEDEDTLNLIMTIPPEGFGDELQYVFHVDSYGAYGGEATETLVMCTFDTDQKASCWAGDEVYVTGDASDPQSPLRSKDGRFKVFTGERNDPFFFNMDGFMDVVTSVRAIRDDLADPDDDGCPQIDRGTATTMFNNLALDADSRTVTDDFAGENVTALVIQMDKNLVAKGGDVLGIWASTNARTTTD